MGFISQRYSCLLSKSIKSDLIPLYTILEVKAIQFKFKENLIFMEELNDRSERIRVEFFF